MTRFMDELARWYMNLSLQTSNRIAYGLGVFMVAAFMGAFFIVFTHGR